MSKERSFPESTVRSAPALSHACIVHRLGFNNGLKTRTYLTCLTVGIGLSQRQALSHQGNLLLRSEAEKVGIDPGNHELPLRFWQTEQRSKDGFEIRRLVFFKVTK